MVTKPCPRCGNSAILTGKGAANLIDQYFQPDGVRWLQHLLRHFGRSCAVRLREPYQACLDCGLVWNNAPPVQLREILEREGIPVGAKEDEPELA